MIREFYEMFRKPSPQILAQRELEEAQRKLLEAQTGRDYAESMVSYREKQVRRLQAQIKVWADDSRKEVATNP